MRSGSARFLTFNCHDSFQHVRLDQDCEFDSNRNSVKMTIELKEFIEKLVEEFPLMPPRELFKEVQNCFFRYSERYWSKSYKSICSYRLTLKQKLKVSGHGSEKYHNDSFISIKEWVDKNTFDIVSSRSDFSIFSLFVAGHELVPDVSPPPTNPTERKGWKPNHRIRVVLCSIAMALNFPILQLKPSLFRYFCVSADSTL